MKIDRPDAFDRALEEGELLRRTDEAEARSRLNGGLVIVDDLTPTEDRIMRSAMEFSRCTQWPLDVCVRAVRDAEAMGRQLTLDAPPASRRPGFVHNVIAHPLLVLCPPLGRWLHERTRP